VEKLRANLNGVGQLALEPKNKRIVFVDAPPAGKRRAPKAAEPGPSEPGPSSPSSSEEVWDPWAGVGGATNANGAGGKGVAGGKAPRKRGKDWVDPKIEKKLAARYSELKQREVRQVKLGQVMQRISQERALIGKGRRKKLQTEEGQPRQFKWRQERKK